jgi:predicted dehydrogenase
MKADYLVVIIGAGGIARRHLLALESMDQVRCVSIADLQESRAVSYAKEFHARAYRSYQEMLEQEEPDIAIITLPHYLHHEAVMACAARHIHMLLEKPMGLSVAECDEMIDAAVEGHAVLMIGHTQHYLPENRAAKDWIDSGRLGRILMLQDTRHIHYFNETRPSWFFRQKESGGGILANLGSHSVDKLQWFTGQRVSRVLADVIRPGTVGDVEGAGLVMLQTAGGVTASLCLSGYKGAPRNETEIIFTGGMLRLSSEGLWVSEGGDYRQVELTPQKDPFILQLEDLITSIESGQPPDCHPAYSRSLVAVTEAIYRSGETGQVIRL